MRARRSRSTLFLAALLALAYFPLAADDGGSSMRASLSRSRLRAALALEAEGKASEAMAMLEEAVELDGSSSDALYALALRTPAGPGRFSLIERAVSSDRWDAFQAKDAVIELSRSLILRGDFDRAEKLLSAARDLGAEGALLSCRSAYFAGKADLYSERIDEATSRYPDDPVIARFWLERADSSDLSELDRRVLKRILARLSLLSDLDGELRVLAAPFIPDAVARRNVVRTAFASGQKGRLSTISFLAERLMAPEEAIEDFFDSGLPPPSFSEAASMAEALAATGGIDRFKARLASYSGTFVEDERGDGYPELRSEYVNGEIARSSYDADQDENIDSSVEYSDGSPSRTIENDGSRIVSISYIAYPEVAKAEFTEDGTVRSYELKAGGLSRTSLSLLHPFAALGVRMRKPVRNPDAPILSESSVMRASSRVIETAARTEASTEPLTLATELRDGLPLSSERRKGSVVLERIEYRQGKPVNGSRDSDGDGRLETSIRYPAAYEGKIGLEPFAEYRVDVDADGDGISEYREEGVPLRVKNWDYDSDGLFDSREEADTAGRITRSFSSKLNGVMDVTVVFERGEPRSVTRGRTRLKVIQETGRSIFWIGRKPFDIGDALPARDGLHALRGQRFLLFRVGESAMLEPLP